MSIMNFGRKEPQMPEPRNLDQPYDSDLEAALTSAAAIRTMRDKIVSLEIDRDHWRAQAEIWKARAEAEASLLLDIKRERDKYADFKTEMVRQFKNCDTMIREMMQKATDFALRPQDAPPPPEGDPAPQFLTERNLQEKPDAQ